MPEMMNCLKTPANKRLFFCFGLVIFLGSWFTVFAYDIQVNSKEETLGVGSGLVVDCAPIVTSTPTRAPTVTAAPISPIVGQTSGQQKQIYMPTHAIV